LQNLNSNSYQQHPHKRKVCGDFLFIFIFEKITPHKNTLIMRKIILGLAFLAVVTVSCKEETKEKLDEAKEAVTSEVEEKIDTATVKVEKAVDTLQAKTSKVLEKGAEKLDKAADKMKEAAKK
jgi:hypothetical protein